MNASKKSRIAHSFEFIGICAYFYIWWKITVIYRQRVLFRRVSNKWTYWRPSNSRCRPVLSGIALRRVDRDGAYLRRWDFLFQRQGFECTWRMGHPERIVFQPADLRPHHRQMIQLNQQHFPASALDPWGPAWHQLRSEKQMRKILIPLFFLFSFFGAHPRTF